MPLIIVSGYPSSGKTHRTRQLIEDFVRRIDCSDTPNVKRLSLHHISDDSLSISRDAYASAREEKNARAAFASAVKRALGPDAIVVADGMNYIKGFRYQLYCEAKAMRTPSCIVHVGTPAAKCRELNDTRDGDRAYAVDVFDNLVFRYEEPNGMNRWDAPLFTVPFDDSRPPSEAIWEALVGSDGKTKVVRPNSATVLKPVAEQDYLYELDRTTSEVIALITSWQQDHHGESGGEAVLAGSKQVITLPVDVPSLPHLQRLRRQFIGLNRQHPQSKSRIRELFIDYLNDAFQK